MLLLFQSPLKRISLELHIDDSIEILVDEALIEQVLINLVKNALEALQETDNPRLIIQAHRGEHIYLSIEDNGVGIDEDKLDKIFIPFFTTKKDGSGIGLPLCRQILRMHKGSLTLISDKEMTRFQITI